MAIIQPMVAQLLINSVLSRKSKARGRSKAEFLLLVSSGFMSLVGIVFLFVALYDWAMLHYAAWMAAVITGGVGLAVGMTFAAIAGGMEAERKRHEPEQAEDPGEALLAAIDRATHGLEKPIADNPRTSVLLASLAGYMTGNKLH
ncbi:MAG TPA: hypothetical protein VEF76_09045 [Patescibacteria group bacterium]|nr:hypothetical protein [Patescibacteria group bacterium]